MLSLPGPVVSVAWLRDHLADPDLRVADVRWSLAGPPGRELLIDARAGERYRGETEPIDPRPGHIPGAVSIPWSTNLDERGRFLSPDRLRARYADLGAADRRVIAYCGSSLSATHDLLAMELAGIHGGRLYEGSWSHWSSDPERPAATGAGST